MGWFEGMLGGFQSRQDQVRKEEMDQANADADRESRVYTALLNSPDKEIATMAASGLLESAGPRKRKSGFSGWLGDMQKSPTYAKLQELINSPVQTSEGTPATLPHTDYGMIAAPPPGLGEAPAGTPAHSLTEPGAPAAPNVPAPKQIPGSVGTPPTFGPRKVFPSAEDLATQTARGKAAGDVEGDVTGLVAAGFSDVEARQIVKEERLRKAQGASGYQSIAGEVPNADGTTSPAYGVLDRVSGQYLDPNTRQPLMGFRPRTTTGSTSLGADREAIAREMFGRPATQLTSDQIQKVNQEAIKRTQDIAFNRGMGTGRAKIATDLNAPIGPTAARQYNVSPTTTLSELSSTVGLTDTQKDRLYATGQVDVLIGQIESLIPDVFPEVDPGLKGVIQTALSLGAQKLSGSDDLAALDASINAALAQIAQLSGQPGSRLSDKDIELAKSTLVNLTPSLFGGDTINTARARLGVVKDLLAKAKSSIPTTPQIGAPPPGSAAPAAKPTTPGANGGTGIFHGDDGELHRGSPTGPVI